MMKSAITISPGARGSQRGTPLAEPQSGNVQSEWWNEDPRWYPYDTPPRRHNRVLPLVHGDRYFAALRAALASAKSYVYVVGWSFTPYLPLGRSNAAEQDQTRLLTLLSEVAERVPVRLLLWAGAPAVLQPTSRQAAAAARTIEAESRGDLQVRLDARAGVLHAIHQKAIVVDGRIAFVGGMDLTTNTGDRWDTAQHPLRAGLNWHDVQVQLEGEAVVDVERNFRQRWAAVGGEEDLPHREPTTDSSWQTPVQVVRTIPHGIYPFAPEGEYGIRHAYTEALRRARRLIYLENQYLWSPDVMDALLTAIDAPHSEPFRIVLVLPAHARWGQWDNDRHVEQLRQADAGRGIVSVYSPFATGVGSSAAAFAYRPIYVHAKVGIVDDEWFTIGSANLNGRGLVRDGELNAVVRDSGLARQFRVELWAEHLGLPPQEVAAADPILLVDEIWSGRAAANAATARRAERPLTGTIQPYETKRSRAAWFLEEAQVLTLDR
jgi:phosphatidylserine/phosphatidylglycerophosphate/cardiolipin synthase-like enzyme